MQTLDKGTPAERLQALRTLADIGPEARGRAGGFILLLHLGSGREDTFHPHLGPLCDELHKRGYKIVRIDRLLAMPAGS